MKRIALLTLAVFLAHGWTFALTYDPTTNSYIDDKAADSTTSSSTSTSADATDDNAPTVSSVGGASATPKQTTKADTTSSTKNALPTGYGPAGGGENTTTQTTAETSKQIVSSGNRDGSLEYIHDLLDSHGKTLLASLQSNYSTLQKEMDDLFGDTEQSRLAALQCLNIIDDEFDIIDQVDVTYKQLLTKVEIVMTDIHAEISALESKIDEGLLEKLDENLQIAAVQNKVEAFSSEYANVVNTFYELSRDELQDVDLVVDKEKDKYKDVLAVYDERVALYQKLEKEYETFLSKSSFAGALAGPNMQELLDSIHELEVYYRSVFISDWKKTIGNHIPDNNQSFKVSSLDGSLQAFSNTFSAKADAILGGLYPVEKLQLMHNSMLTIRAAYLQENGTYDCQAFASNKTINNAADELIEDMDLLLENLNKAVNKIAKDTGELPKTVEALKKALRTSLQSEGDAFIDVLVSQEKARIESLAKRDGVSWLSVGVSSESSRWEKIVRQFLQKSYAKALSDGKVVKFQSRLQKAYDRIDTVMETKKPEGRTKGMLLAIKTVIEEFLD